MRLPHSLLISALCCTAQLASAVQVYTFDPESQSLPRGDADSRSRTLTPSDARLVLAQRAGVEDYHLDALLSPGGIDAINEFGLREEVFGEDNARRKSYVVLVDGWDGIHGTYTSSDKPLVIDIKLQKDYPLTIPSSPNSRTQLPPPNQSLHNLTLTLAQCHTNPLPRPRSPEAPPSLPPLLRHRSARPTRRHQSRS